MTHPRIAVSLHLFALELLPEFVSYLANITKAGYHYDLYVSILRGSDTTPVKQAWPQATVLLRENRGFDIASFLASLHYILPKQYDYVLKLHSKSHPHWRKELIEPLLSSPARVRHTIQLLQDPSIGMVSCEKWLIPLGADWGNNATHIQNISRLWHVPVGPCKFVGGTIFWMRHDILKKAAHGVDLLAVANSLNTAESLDYSWYLMAYPDLRALGVVTRQDAERHWQKIGKQQGRACNCLYARLNHIGVPNCDGMHEHAYERFFGLLVANAGKETVGLSEHSLLSSSRLHTMVLYHPQQPWPVIQANLHGIQPHPDIGYYNSNDSTTLQRQHAMMMRYGVQGVCYRLAAETMGFLDVVQRTPTELPFCLSWNPQETLDPSRLAGIFTHDRYMKVNGKPVVFFERELPPNVTPAEFVIIRDFLDIPKTHSLQYRGIVLGDQSRHLSQELVDLYNRQLATRNEGERFVVLRSWNDWLNQVALEPSKSFGYKNLQELRGTLRYFE
jgi:hypothetical protein